MPFLSYHMKIDIEASGFPRSCRNPVAGESHPHVPIHQDSSGQPAVTMVTSVNDGVLPQTVVTPFSFQRSSSEAGCQWHMGFSVKDSTSPGPEQRLWPHCLGAGCNPTALGT